MQPTFSIVIPTRNRPETLFHAVRTCLADPENDYQVIVFDNATSPIITRELLGITDPRMVIQRSEETLPMINSWETAVSYATGKYVILVGDDDGLIPSTLSVLRPLIEKYPDKPIRWARASYHWPTHPVEIKRDTLKIPLSNEGYILDAKAVIKAVAEVRIPHFIVPMLYNAAIPQTIIQQIKKRCGRLFLGPSPDVTSGIAAAYIAGTFVSLETPLSIGGTSGKSNGLVCTTTANLDDLKKKSAVASEYLKLSDGCGYPYPHPKLPKISLPSVVRADSFLYTKQALFADDQQLSLNFQQLVNRCWHELHEKPAAERPHLIAQLKQYVEQNPGLHLPAAPLPEANAAKPSGMQRPSPRGYDESERLLCLDTTSFGITDVFGASQLCEKILAYKNRGLRLQIKTPKQKLKNSGRRLLADLVRRRELPNFIDCD